MTGSDVCSSDLWDTHYGYFPDPAFILPWRYDPEKGYSVSEVKRKQTNDIQFYPEDPANGDTVTIRARIHNFSLLPTPRPVGVRFYLGDPDDDGMPIESIDGHTEIFTPEAIAPRGRAELEMKWKVPEGTPSFPRIYAVIDKDDQLMEIHENNNISWNIMQKTTGSIIDNVEEEKFKHELFVAYNQPNPFNELTQIRFTLPSTSLVNISVYNMMGQRITTLAAKVMTEGSHIVEFDRKNYPSGIYFCNITAGNTKKVIKMILK